MAAYWDTSCVLKLYCREPDSDYFLHALATEAEPVRSSILLEAEIHSAFQQKFVRGETGGQNADDLFDKFKGDVQAGLIRLYPLGSDVIQESTRLVKQCHAASPRIPIRTLDALHLATARLSGCERLVTTDHRMQAAASLFGFGPTKNLPQPGSVL